MAALPDAARADDLTGSVLDDLHDWLARYIVPTEGEDLWALTLWATHTHFLDQAGASPRLLLTSALPESGKTTALEHLERFTADPLLIANAPTPAYAARVAERHTLLIDEADTHVGGGGDAGQLFGIVNAGYRPSGTYGVLEADESGKYVPVQHPVFGAVAMAGISPTLPPAFLTRCITVHLSPDVYDEAEESDWETIGADADALAERLREWAAAVVLDGGETMPNGVKGRMRELWRPLKRIANAAGDDWPARCDALMQRALDDRAADRADGLDTLPMHALLVRDIYGVWHLVDPEHEGFAPTTDLLLALRNGDPERWGDQQGSGRRPLTPQRMGRMLTKYGIRSGREPDGERRRGYHRDKFVRTWRALGIEPDRVFILPSEIVA